MTNLEAMPRNAPAPFLRAAFFAALLFLATPALGAFGGGGCFLAGTPVTLADGSTRAIEAIVPGDAVLAFSPEGRLVPARVLATYRLEVEGHLDVKISGNESGTKDVGLLLEASAEHPFYVGEGRFVALGELGPGDRVYARAGNAVSPRTITTITAIPGRVTVFNLGVEEPCTFIAGGIIVHNKGGASGGGSAAAHGGSGGGGSGGGYSGGGNHGAGSGLFGGGADRADLGTEILVLGVALGCMGLYAAWKKRCFGRIARLLRLSRRNGKSGTREQSRYGITGGSADAGRGCPLDRVASGRGVKTRAAAAKAVLAKIAANEEGWEPERLKEVAESSYRALQRAWEARDYSPMAGKATENLERRHRLQLEGLRRSHEINVVGDLDILSIEIIHVRYDPARGLREFAVLVDVKVRDYYVDDRSRAFLRGDEARERFQEIHVFTRARAGWLLCGIEQVRESRRLRAPFLYRPAVLSGQPMPGSRGEHGEPAGMEDFAALAFTRVYMFRDGGDDDLADLLEPAPLALLLEERAKTMACGTRVGYRNFCVRGVRILRRRTEAEAPCFTARIHAHAQVAGSSSAQGLCRFAETWTFKREGNNWKVTSLGPRKPRRA